MTRIIIAQAGSIKTQKPGVVVSMGLPDSRQDALSVRSTSRLASRTGQFMCMVNVPA